MNRVPNTRLGGYVTKATGQRPEQRRAGLGTDWFVTPPLQETSIFFLSLALARNPLKNAAVGDGGATYQLTRSCLLPKWVLMGGKASEAPDGWERT